jgi:hypothetical protein
MSVFDKSSEISQLNKFPAKKYFKLSEELSFVLQTSKKIWQQSDGWFTPLMAVLLLLILALANLFYKRPYIDWGVLAMQTVLGIILVYLMYFSNLCCTSWNWLLIPFNPLPALCWKWRRYWALPYTGILLIWTMAMMALALWGHILVDWSHILLAVAWMLIVLKQSNIIKHVNG